MNAVAVSNHFEFVALGFTLKSQSIDDSPRSTASNGITWADRVAAISFMDSQMAKSITMLICLGKSQKSDYEYVKNTLAKLMLDSAYDLKKAQNKTVVEPDNIALYALAWNVAGMMMEFFFGWRDESNFTAKGRLEEIAGISSKVMTFDAYRKTWKQFEDKMELALLLGYSQAESSIVKHRKALREVA